MIQFSPSTCMSTVPTEHQHKHKTPLPLPLGMVVSPSGHHHCLPCLAPTQPLLLGTTAFDPWRYPSYFTSRAKWGVQVKNVGPFLCVTPCWGVPKSLLSLQCLPRQEFMGKFSQGMYGSNRHLAITGIRLTDSLPSLKSETASNSSSLRMNSFSGSP